MLTTIYSASGRKFRKETKQARACARRHKCKIKPERLHLRVPVKSRFRGGARIATRDRGKTYRASLSARAGEDTAPAPILTFSIMSKLRVGSIHISAISRAIDGRDQPDNASRSPEHTEVIEDRNTHFRSAELISRLHDDDMWFNRHRWCSQEIRHFLAKW